MISNFQFTPIISQALSQQWLRQCLITKTCLVLEVFPEELLDRVCVPFVDSQRLHHLAISVQQLDDWVGTAGVAHSQSGELLGALALDEGLNLWESTQFSVAHNQFSIGVFCHPWLLLIFLATLQTVSLDCSQIKVIHHVTC